MTPDELVLYIIALGFSLLVIVLVYAIASSATRLRTKSIRVLIRSGDILIEKTGRITEEGLIVDGKVYPLTRDAIMYVRRGPRLYAYVVVDSNTNAVYTFNDNSIEAKAPPELLHRIALKRIMRHLTRREINVLPFLTGLLVGLLLLAAAGVVLYQHVVVPSEAKAARADAILSEYNQLKSQYQSLKTQYDQLDYKYQQLLERYNNVTSMLDACLNQTQPVNATNSTVGG